MRGRESDFGMGACILSGSIRKFVDSDSVPRTVRINSQQQKHEVALCRLDAGAPFTGA